MKHAELVKAAKAHKGSGYWYLASPYSKYPLGTEAANTKISQIARDLMLDDLVILSPIAGSHSIAMAGYDGGWESWEQLDCFLIYSNTCKGIIVAKMDTWADSVGMAAEIDLAVALQKPVLFLEVED